MADDNPNVMQAQLGLMGGGSGGSMAPFGMPTPMPMPPPMRHPGDAARDAVQMTQTMAMNTMQSAQAVSMASMGTPGGGFSGNGGGGGGWGMGGFANQYRQNMAGIQQQQLNPWLAGSMASMMGQGGYQAGMLPSPIQMTQPHMGIYRPPPPMPMGQIPPMPPMPLFPTPFTPNMPSPMFSTPFDYNMQRGELRGIQNTAAALSLPGVGARAGNAAFGGWAGAGLGAHMGARFGAGGAAIGSAVGGLAGMMGAEHFFGAGVQGFVDQMNPFDRMARHTAQIRGMSQDFVVGGGGLHAGGRGLSLGASAHVGRQLNNLAADSGFQRQTGSQFSSQDLMKITQVSGQQGMLDMAQNPEQIVGQVKNVAKALTAFMKLAGEPDVTEALRQMGQMRQMGLSLGETMQATQQAKHFARMSGTSVRGVMEAGGLPGAMVFQQQGLSAGLGMQVGMGSLGMARQAVAGGTYTTQQLAMLGGTQGIAQNNMEMSAAMLKQPLMAAAMSGFGAGGTFGLRGGNMQRLAGGGLGIDQLATMGVNNMTAAVAQGGISALGSFQMQQGELQDQMGRALGPEGIKMMGFQQIRSTRGFLGLKGPGGTFAAAKAMGMTDDQAKQSTLEMSSPEFFQNMQRQIHVTRQEQRAEARERRLETTPSLVDSLAQRSETFRGVRGAARNIGTGWDDMIEGATSAMARSGEESAANRSGQTIVRRGKVLLSQNPLESRMLNQISAKQMRDAGVFSGDVGAQSDAIFRTGEGRGIGNSAGLASWRDDVFGGNAFDVKQVREAEGGWSAFFGGGSLETASRFLTAGTGFAGGDEMRARAANFQRGSESTTRGLGATASEKGQAHKSIAKSLGVDNKTAAKVTTVFEKKLAAIAREKHKLAPGENRQLDNSDYERAIEETAKETGQDPAKLKQSRKDLETAGVRGAQALSGAQGSSSFRGVDFVGKGGLLKDIEDATQRQTNRGIELMGDEGGLLGKFGLGGDATRREAVMQEVFGNDEDKRVGLLAALREAASTDDPAAKARYEAYLTQVKGEKGGSEVIERSINMQSNMGENKDMLARMGKRLAGKGSIAEMVKAFDDTGAGYSSEKKGQVYKAGLEKIADKSLVASVGSADPQKILAAAGKKGTGLKGKASKLAQEYNTTTDPGRRAEIEEEFVRQASGMGEVSESTTAGGSMDAAADRQADAKSAMVGSEASAAASDFPNAVAQFADASRSLERAANALGTRLGDGVNPWGG